MTSPPNLAGSFEPPYTAVIFTSSRTEGDQGYADAAERMDALSAQQPGYLGIDSARDPRTGLGITVSYWTTHAAASAWKAEAEHRAVQDEGRRRWYRDYVVRIATVDRDYSGPDREDGTPGLGRTDGVP